MISATGAEWLGHRASIRLSVGGSVSRQIIAATLACIFFAYLLLIGAGQWQADEYGNFAEFARSGWRALLPRMMWSPRPFSEVLFFLYGTLVNHLRWPLIVPFLGLLWVGLLVAALLTWWEQRRQGQPENSWPDLLLGLALLASFVTSGPLMEVFYWPAGAVAYLPTLSATALFFLQVAAGRLETPKGRAVCGVCLLVAACSTEAGAIFAALYAVVQVVGVTTKGRRAATQDGRDGLIWWLLPALVSAVVLIVLRLNRYESSEAIFGPVPSFERSSGAIVTASLREWLLEIAGTNDRYHAWHGITARMVSLCLLALGAGLVRRFGRRANAAIQWQLSAVVVALLAASLGTIFAAELHFGAECCPRHEVLRRCWMMMSFAGIGMVLFSRVDAARFAEGRRRFALLLGPVLLCVGAVASWHTRELIRTYRIYSRLHTMSAQNFRLGFDRDSPTMEFVLPPDRGLIFGMQIDPGTYTLATAYKSTAHDYYLRFILIYFDKRTIVVRQFDE